MQRHPEHDDRDEQEPELIHPGEAVRRARKEHQQPPADESTTDVDQVRESGFGA